MLQPVRVLREHHDDTAIVLRELLKLDIERISRIDVEEAPDPEPHLGDRTAFDAFVEYRDSRSGSGFLGIETKYTEPFSTKQYTSKRNESLTTEANDYRPGAADRLKGAWTNQLWRNALLAISLRQKSGYTAGHAIVLACEGDRGAPKALAGVRAELIAPDSLLRSATLEALIGAFIERDAVLGEGVSTAVPGPCAGVVAAPPAS